MVKKVIADNDQIIYSVESEDAQETQTGALVSRQKSSFSSRNQKQVAATNIHIRNYIVNT